MNDDRPDEHEIGAYDAKTRLPELLRRVQAGSRFTITHRGRPVAVLGPVGDARAADRAHAVERLKALMLTAPVQNVDLRELIDEGRD